MIVDPQWLPPGAISALQWVSVVILVSGLFQNATYLLQTVMAFLALRRVPPKERESAPTWGVGDRAVMPVSILVPAHDEQSVIVDSVESLLRLDYPRFEVVVVNDGSSDATLPTLIDAFGLKRVKRVFRRVIPHRRVLAVYESERHSNLVVVDKENGGKSDALNAGINLSRFPLFCAVDADSILESRALEYAAEPFNRDPARVIVTGGTIRVANGCTFRDGQLRKVGLPHEFLALFQWVEYLRAFLMGRLGWSELDSMLLVSGAFGIFRRRVVELVGGYDTNTVGEDLELTVKIHRYLRESDAQYFIRFMPDPVCWTQVPTTLAHLGRQRRRWQRGAMETFAKHWHMALNPRYGRIGMVAFVNSLIVDIVGPPLEVLGYVLVPALFVLSILDWPFFLAYLAVTFVFGVFISVTTLVLEEMELRQVESAKDLLILFGAAIIENFGYRQLNTVWRAIGWAEFVRGRRGWGAKTRTVFQRG